jgi:iron complex outermembrane recepter protein
MSNPARSSRRTGRARTAAVLALTVSATVAMSAQSAATAPTEPAKPADVTKMEGFVVTGSAIPVAESETYSPVTVYSTTDIARHGSSLPIEVLRSLPGFTGAVNTEQRTNGGTGAASVNLRGLAGTLTLLDGHRTAGFDNYNVLPTIAIQRIEIVKDGASAIYGSDALSGVFNTVLTERFTGQKLDTYYGNTTKDDAGVLREAVMVGAAHGNTDIVVAGEYYHRNALYSSDRDVSADSDGRLRGGKNQGSATFSGRATARVGSATAPVQDLVLAPGKTVGLTASDFVAFDPNATTSNQLLNFRAYTPSIPKQAHANAYARINEKLGPNVEAYARILYAHDIFYNGLAPSPMPAPSTGTSAARDLLLAERASVQIPTGFFIQDDTRSATGNILNGAELFRTITLGPRSQTFRRDVWDFISGLRGGFAQDWSWTLNYTYSDFYRHYVQAGAPGKTKLVAHIRDGSYNPWALDTAKGVGPTGVAFDNPKALADSAASGLITQHAPTRGFNASSNGSLFALPGGEVKLGFGGDYYRDNFSEIPDPIFFTGDLLGLNGSNPTISRDYGAGIFAELQVPIISPAMHIPAVQSLSLSLAGRYDYKTVEGYANGSSGVTLSRSFTTNNPKVGLRWMLTDDLLIRGTWSTGFRLPSLVQLFNAPGTSNPQLTDPLGFVIGTQTPITTGGNPNLDPEKSKTYSYGLVFSPKAIAGLSLNVDYYFGEIKGLVGEGSQYIVNVNAAGQGAGFVRGNAATLNPNAPFANLITRSASGGITTVNSTNFNISSRKTTGVDYAVTYVWPGREWGRFTTRGDWNTVLSWDLTPLPGAPAQSFVGVFLDTSNNAISPGSVPRQKGYISQLWEKGPWSVILTGNYISKLEDDPNFSTVTGTVRYISAWPTADAQVAYKFGHNEAGWKRWANDTTVRIGGTNILDRSAPFAAGAFNDFYDVKTHSSRGRFLYTEISKQF